MAKVIKITDRKQFPKWIRKFDCLKGICVGRCVLNIKGFNTILRESGAHAHLKSYDPCKGWICVPSQLQLLEKFLLLHEVAHLLVSPYEKAKHGKLWRAKVIEIGGTLQPFWSVDPDTGCYPGYYSNGHYYYDKNVVYQK